MTLHGKKTAALALALLLSLSLSACGGSGGDAASASYTKETGQSANMMADGNFSPMAEEEALAESAAQETGSEDAGNAETLTPQNENRKLITTVRMEAETKEYDSFFTWLEDRLDQAGGYMETSDMYAYDENSRSCQLKLRVPAEKLDGFLSAVGESCNVLSRSVSEEDITLNYVDAQSYRDALRVEQERLLELLEQAETLEDILSLEDRLTTVRYQLQNYESTLRVYDSQVNYSTVYLDLREVRELTEPVPESWGSRALSGMKENARDIGRFFQELGLFLVTHLPTFALLGVIVVLVLVFTAKPRRRARERRKQQREMIRAMQEESQKKEKKD